MRLFAPLRFLMLLMALLVPVFPVTAAPSVLPDPAQLKQDEAALQGVEGEVASIETRIKAVQQSIKVIRDKQTELQTQADQLQAQSNAMLPELHRQAAEYQRRQKSLMEALETDYKAAPANPLFLVVSAGSISESLDTAVYTASFQTKIQELSTSAEKARDDMQDRKRQLDGRRSTLETLNREQAQLRAGVEQQQAQLQELLANRANEAAYLSARIAGAKQQQEALLKATLSSSGDALWGTFTDGARVKRGDLIGLEGTTGNSTGCHLHFSAIKDGQWIDPAPLLQVGILQRPLAGQETQSYGMTDYAKSGAYGGGIHNGIDMSGGCNTHIHAAADGVVIRDNRTDGSGFGHYVMIRHADGLITLYGHLT